MKNITLLHFIKYNLILLNIQTHTLYIKEIDYPFLLHLLYKKINIFIYLYTF